MGKERIYICIYISFRPVITKGEPKMILRVSVQKNWPVKTLNLELTRRRSCILNSEFICEGTGKVGIVILSQQAPELRKVNEACDQKSVSKTPSFRSSELNQA